MIGETLGNYRVVEQIGMGGMATVYKAYDPDTDRYVALKILPRHLSQDPTFKERFNREAKAIARLEHLHIIPIYTYGEDHGVAYMAMRYLPVGTLTDRIRRGPLPLPEASRLLTQIAGALDYAHSHGVLHRDIKPSNVLLDEAGNAFLTDFGIAKMVESTVDLTAGNILGTPAYMSPEQCQGIKELTPASDIYSLGIVLYEMVTGTTPFRAETPVAIIYKQLHEALPPPHQLRPDLPDEAQQVILKALTKAPESRYANCAQMATAFAAAVAGSPTVPALEAPTLVSGRAGLLPAAGITRAQPSDSATVAAAPRTNSRWLWPGVALVALLLLAGVALLAGRFALRRAVPPPTSSGPITAPTENPPTPTQAAPAEAPPTEKPASPQASRCAPGETELFFDDFEQGQLPDWRFFDAAGQPDKPWKIGYDGDNRVLVGMGHRWADVGDESWKDYRLRLRYRLLDVERSTAHINLRVTEGRYYVNLAAGMLSRDHMAAGEENQQLARWAAPTDSEWHELVLLAVGGRVEVLLNGREVAAYNDPNPIPGGPMGLENLSNKQVWYDDVLVCRENPPPAGGEAGTPPQRVEPCLRQKDDAPGLCIYTFGKARPEIILADSPLTISGDAAFSPDGRQIVFSALEPGEKPIDHNLYIINRDGSGLTQLTPSSNDIIPAWSPDGEWLAFHSGCDLALVHPDGSERVHVWQHPNSQSCVGSVQWSPDSRRLVFSDMPPGEMKLPTTRRVAIISVDGQAITPLFTLEQQRTDCDYFKVAFGPDGQRVAYFDGECKPQLVNITGSSRPRPLPEFPIIWTANYFPQWPVLSK